MTLTSTIAKRLASSACASVCSFSLSVRAWPGASVLRSVSIWRSVATRSAVVRLAAGTGGGAGAGEADRVRRQLRGAGRVGLPAPGDRAEIGVLHRPVSDQRRDLEAVFPLLAGESDLAARRVVEDRRGRHVERAIGLALVVAVL